MVKLKRNTVLIDRNTDITKTNHQPQDTNFKFTLDLTHDQYSLKSNFMGETKKPNSSIYVEK